MVFDSIVFVLTLSSDHLYLISFLETLNAFSTLLFLTSIVIAILVLKFYLGYILNPSSGIVDTLPTVSVPSSSSTI